jgi:SsrA-binding protein
MEYEVLEKFQAGIVLTGGEVKSIRKGSGSLQGSFVKPVGDELFLIGAQITPYQYADNKEYDPKRSRKLLLKKREIFALREATSAQGKNLIPLALELVGRNIKLTIAIARGKKLHDRRKELRERDLKRDAQKELKHNR